MGINLKSQDIERILQVKTRSEEYHVEKVPVADPRGTSPAPTDQNFLNFMQFLGGKSGKFVCWRPLLEGWRSLLRGILDPPLGANNMLHLIVVPEAFWRALFKHSINSKSV